MVEYIIVEKSQQSFLVCQFYGTDSNNMAIYTPVAPFRNSDKAAKYINELKGKRSNP